ncbi:MAG: hypothetical protein KKD77_23810 [Gammaproteobacteria bacterium]|nr:hypothetical protein [Gammaproteobacteria bacterium]
MNTKKINISWWIDQINAGIRFRKKYAQEQKWEMWRAYYRGEWQHDILPVNLFFMMTRIIVPRVYFRNPSVSVVPAKPGELNMAFAQLQERVDNKLLRKLKVKRQMKRIVQDAFMFGTGVGKLGFGAQFSPTPDLDTTEQPYKKGARVEYHANIYPDHPWFLRVHPGNFIVPSGADSGEDCMWKALWIRRPLQDVKDDPRFKDTADLAPTSKMMIEDSPKVDDHGIPKPVEMIDLYEVKDTKYGRVFVLAPTANKVLYEGMDELQTENSMGYYELIFNDDDEVFWGVPDSQILEPYQLEINEIRTQSMKHRRLAIARILAKIGSIEPAEAEKLLSEDVAPVIWTKEDPRLAVHELQTAHTPPELDAAKLEVLNDVRETLGFSRNQSGEYASRGLSGVPTATEAKIVQMASEIRIDERRDMVADMLVDLVNDWHRLIHTHWTEEQVIDITGPLGVKLWVQFSGKMLRAGSYETTVDPDSSLPETKQLREAKAEKVYMILKENPLIDPQKLTRYFLREHYGVQYDDMMRGIPEGAGQSQQQPMQIGQYAQMLGQAGRAGLPMRRG